MTDHQRAHTPKRSREAGRPRVPSGIRRVLILVPCHDEEAGLAKTVERLHAVLPALRRPSADHEREVEICLFDDASRDGTWALMQSLAAADPTIRPVQAPHHLNIGGALRHMLARTDADAIVLIDADGTYAPAEIGRLLDALETGADVATGSPYHPQGRVEGVPAWRLAISRTLSRIYRAAGHGPYYTFTAMFRAYRVSALAGIRFANDGFLSAAEILVEAHRQGLAIDEVPVTLSTRKAGRSKIRIVRVVIDHLRYLGRLALAARPPVTPGHQSNL